MWRAMGAEVRRAVAMTIPGMRPVAHGERPTGRSWVTDRHLLRGYLLALPVFFIGAVIALAVGWPHFRHEHDPWPLFAVLLPFALLANVLWFYFAARSRMRSGGA